MGQVYFMEESLKLSAVDCVIAQHKLLEKLCESN